MSGETFIEALVATSLGSILATVIAIYIIPPPPPNRWKIIISVFIIFSTLILLTDLTPIPIEETIRVALFGPPSQNERWTHEAWEAYERGDYLAAISSAGKVIDQYAGVAEDEQGELESQKEPPPPTGKASPRDAEKTFSRGVLNDVAACYWIIGQSHEKMGEGCEAKSAYSSASRLTYARVWDPQWWPLRGWSPFGWFWSPAQYSSYRISKVSC